MIAQGDTRTVGLTGNEAREIELERERAQAGPALLMVGEGASDGVVDDGVKVGGTDQDGIVRRGTGTGALTSGGRRRQR